jgi:HK97 gp10 family phage protein
MSAEIKLQGMDQLKADLKALVPKLRVLRNALAAGARLVQRAARAATPTINAMALAVRKGYRKPGTVRQAISVRTSKMARRSGDVGVFVNVRPAKGARFKTKTYNLGVAKLRTRTKTRASQRGAKSPNDPFYWRFLEFGTAKTRKFEFLQKGAARLGDALKVFEKTIGPQIQKLNKPKAPAP